MAVAGKSSRQMPMLRFANPRAPQTLRSATAAIKRSEFSMQPFEDARAVWSSALDNFDNVTLYHGERWLRGLVETYRLKLWVAALHENDAVAAACLFARTWRPFASARFVALPFSDLFPPLARDANACTSLLEALARNPATKDGCELRGPAPTPWHTVDCFANWSLNLARPLCDIEHSFDRDFRRKIRRGGEACLTIQRGADIGFVKRFYQLQVETRQRLGLPAQPLRLFTTLRDIFGVDGDFEVWLASHDGHDLAGAVLLRDAGRVYMKWSARRPDAISSANHLLVWNVIQAYAGQVTALDLGRTDVRNAGLARFKKEAGATATPLIYSYLPAAPRHVSSEVLTGMRKLSADIWRRLPLSVARIAGGAFYRYLA
jgi:hypothetical protein